MKYIIEKTSLKGSKIQGYCEVRVVAAVVDPSTCQDATEVVDLLIHENLHAINHTLEHQLDEETIDAISQQLALILIGLGFKPIDIPEEGLTIEA